jgi:transposase
MDIDEPGKRLKLWVRRKKAGLKLICSRCGQHVSVGTIHEVCEREVRDLPCFEYTTTVVVETYRVKCPRCGIRAEKVAQLPSKAPFSKRFEEAVGQACESAAARRWRDGPLEQRWTSGGTAPRITACRARSEAPE